MFLPLVGRGGAACPLRAWDLDLSPPFIDCIGVTLVNRIMQVSGAQFHNTSSVHCTVCSPPQVDLLMLLNTCPLKAVPVPECNLWPQSSQLLQSYLKVAPVPIHGRLLSTSPTQINLWLDCLWRCQERKCQERQCQPLISPLGGGLKTAGRGERETPWWGRFPVVRGMMRATIDWGPPCTRHGISLFSSVLETDFSSIYRWGNRFREVKQPASSLGW